MFEYQKNPFVRRSIIELYKDQYKYDTVTR